MSREFSKAVAVIALVAGGLYAYTRWRSPDQVPQGTAKVSSPHATEATTATDASAATDASITAKHPTAAPAEEDPDMRPVIATVYECTGSQGRILSDKPCADEARVRQVYTPNGMVPTKVEARKRPQEAGSAGADTGTGSAMSLNVVIPPLKTCEQLDKNEALANKRLRENPSEEQEKYLRQLLSGYAATRKEWNCGRAR